MTSFQNRLSEHFTLAEAIFSRTANKLGLDNIPTPEQFIVMTRTATGMEKIRALAGNKVVSISSWFRSKELNEAVGGSPTSQHCTGEAVDFNIFSYGTPRQVCELIVANKDLIRFDQLILEPSWIHVSFLADRRQKPRLDVLTKTPDGKYHSGLLYYK